MSEVTKWTRNKSIDIFSKKFVFVPINESLHWSLCVIVNPRFVLEESDDEEFAFMLFFDSLKAHRKAQVGEHLRKWLNSEWRRLKISEDNPFTVDAMKIFSPEGTP